MVDRLGARHMVLLGAALLTLGLLTFTERA
jgi:hypothetical protein